MRTGKAEKLKDFTGISINVKRKTAAWGAETVEATPAGPDLQGYSADIVADTINPDSGERLTTMVVRFPRCILPEVNTHRVFSRNSASSRARSVRTTIGGVMNDPYIPIFTRNGKGMSGGFLDGPELDKAKTIWLKARDAAVSSELAILLGDLYHGSPQTVKGDWEQYIDLYYDKVYHADHDTGAPSVHKQNANRIIEPYMWHEALITSSYWDNFYRLRIDDAAQPEMHLTAMVMKAAMDASYPVDSLIHVPFIAVNDSDDLDTVAHAFMMSAAECARISYKDRTSIGLKESSALAERMLAAGHMSPFEHQAISSTAAKALEPMFPAHEQSKGMDADTDAGMRNGNLSPSWVQFRHMVS